MMEDKLIIDPNDGMACHVYCNRGAYPWCVRLIDTESGNTVTLRRYSSIELALTFVRACLPNLTLPASESL